MANTLEPVADQVSLPVRFLRPGDTATLTFVPAVGPATVTAIGFERPGQGGLTVGGKPGHLGDDGSPGGGVILKENVSIELSLVPAGSRTPIRKVIKITNPDKPPAGLRVEVPQGQAGRTWTARFRNVGKTDIRLTGRVDFVARILERTAIPVRLLDNSFRQILDLISPQVDTVDKRVVVSVSEDLQRLAGPSLKERSFTLPSAVKSASLRGFDVRALAGTTLPEIQIRLSFSLEVEVDFHGVTLVEVTASDVAVTLTVRLGFRRPQNVQSSVPGLVLPDFEIDVHGKVLAEVLGIDFSVDLKETLQDLIDSGPYRGLVGQYLTDALVELSQRGDRFYDVLADPARGWIVRHFEPHADPGPVQPPNLQFPSAAGIVPAPLDAAELANLTKAGTIVVLMQENRSFDHMLGYLSHPSFGKRADVDGLRGGEFNPPLDQGQAVESAAFGETLDVFGAAGTILATDFPFSPEHGKSEVEVQVHDGKMDGFAASFTKRFPNVSPELVMGFYTSDHLPVYDFLAAEHVVCDRWFSAFPGDTQPNRFCTLSGHTPVQDDFAATDPILGYLQLPTIFDALTAASVDWRYFENDIAFLRLYDKYRLDDEHVIPFSDPNDGFAALARRGALPPVTFIDPNFVDVPPVRTASDDHAPASVRLGQNAIAVIHDLLVQSPQWADGSTGVLFVITYDEHGGFYDHVPPPGTSASTDQRAIAPVHPHGDPFLGVRVPAFVLSPFAEGGTVSSAVFDHTTIIKTIALRFLAQQLQQDPFAFGPRVAQAGHLGGLLTRTNPRQVPTFASRKQTIPNALARRNPQSSVADFHELMGSEGRPVFAR